MNTRHATLSVAFVIAFATIGAHAADERISTITFVDGQQTKVQVLFEHPGAPLLIVRSPEHRTVQSIPLTVVHRVDGSGEAREVNARRSLTDTELLERQRNGVWVDDVGPGQIGQYARQTWEPRAVAVWATPGKSGNAMEPGNWLDETGRPYTDGPWQVVRDRKDDRGRKLPESGAFAGDVLLPAADKPYDVLQPGERDHLGEFELRHLTVERNAHYKVRYTIRGNLWLKDGSRLGGNTQTGGLGSGELDKHTIARVCNNHGAAPADGLPDWAYAQDISHWIYIDTGEHGSMEVVGICGGASDRLTFKRGTLVISEDSYLGNGDRGCFYSQAGTTTILLDGATIGSPAPLTGGSGGNIMATYGIAGTLMFGTPDHPLTRDLVFGAALYPRERVSPNAQASQRSSGASLVLANTGRMVVHSSDPAKARVVFGQRDRRLPFSPYTIPRELWSHLDRRGDVMHPAKPELWEQPGIPNGLAAVLLGQTDFNGVVFDGFYEDGIMIAPNARSRWRNVSFGPNNLAAPEKLFRDVGPAASGAQSRSETKP